LSPADRRGISSASRSDAKEADFGAVETMDLAGAVRAGVRPHRRPPPSARQTGVSRSKACPNRCAVRCATCLKTRCAMVIRRTVTRCLHALTLELRQGLQGRCARSYALR
jgi:hypothetical protein